MNDALIQVYAEVLQVEPAALNDKSSPYNVTQWDSLTGMHLVAAIEERFKVQLSTLEIMRMRTIGLARKMLQSKNVAV
jgi:acyl carrier protein